MKNLKTPIFTCLLSLGLTTLIYGAEPASELSNVIKQCGTELDLEIRSYTFTPKWIEQAPTQNSGRNFRSATDELGQWMELEINKKGAPTLNVVTSSVLRKIEFDSKCVSKTRILPGLDFSKTKPDPLATWFNDAALKEILNSHKEGLIYVWSPEMVYSAKYFKRFQTTARKLKLHFVAVLDPRTKLSLVDQMSKEYGLPPSKQKLNSVELYMRSATVHYPTSFVFKNSRLHSVPIVGVMQASQLERDILNRLSDPIF